MSFFERLIPPEIRLLIELAKLIDSPALPLDKLRYLHDQIGQVVAYVNRRADAGGFPYVSRLQVGEVLRALPKALRHGGPRAD